MDEFRFRVFDHTPRYEQDDSYFGFSVPGGDVDQKSGSFVFGNKLHFLANNIVMPIVMKFSLVNILENPLDKKEE